MTVQWLALALAGRGHAVSVLSVAGSTAAPGGQAAHGTLDRTLGYALIPDADAGGFERLLEPIVAGGA